MNDKKRSRTEYEDALIAECRETFANHTIASRGDGRWVLREPGTSNMQCEIVALAWGTLLVHGDFDHCIWTGYSGKGGPEAIVRWIGRQSGLGYICQKAVKGLEDHRLVEEINGEVLAHNLQEYLDEWRVQNALDDERDAPSEDEQRERERITEALESAIEDAGVASEHDDGHRIVWALADDGVIDSETAGSLGVVTTRRVIRAWQAVARLHELLDEESAASVKNGEGASVEGA
jgi:hypothetical protein